MWFSRLAPSQFRLPGEDFQEGPQRPGMGQVEPLAGHHLAAVDAVFHHAGFVGVVGAENGLPARHFPGPGTIGQLAVTGQRGGEGHDRVLERLAATTGRFGEGPRAGVYAACRARIDAGAAEGDRNDVPDVGFPIAGRPRGGPSCTRPRSRAPNSEIWLLPVPEVMAEGGIGGSTGAAASRGDTFRPHRRALSKAPSLPS